MRILNFETMPKLASENSELYFSIENDINLSLCRYRCSEFVKSNQEQKISHILYTKNITGIASKSVKNILYEGIN